LFKGPLGTSFYDGFALQIHYYNGEFDSGSERTLAARLKHASRTICSNTGSGGRVRNT
jgi:hypothetical protein